jgi:NitT/TauT family transport system permease protein
MNAERRIAGLPLSVVTTTALLIAFLAIWEISVRAFKVEAVILPAPSVVAEKFWALAQTKRFWGHTWVTVYETVGGFFIAVVIGVGLGAVLAKTPWLERTLNPFIVASQVVPKVALVPLFVVWFGFGPTSKIIVAAVLAFFPILTNTVLGVKSVDLGHRDVMASLNATRWQSFMRLELPSALPYILTGMEVGVVLAIIGAIVGEYLGGNQGLGHMTVERMNAFETAEMFAIIVHMTLVGFVFYWLIGVLRRFAIPWHESVMVGRR